MRTLVFEPLIPTALWAALAIGGAALLVWYGRNSRVRLPRGRWLVMLALMAAAIALPLAILLNPLWMERIPPPAGKPLLTVLVDATQSMEHADSASGRSRFAEASGIAAAVADQLSDRYEVHLRTFAKKTTPIEAAELTALKPTGETTDLATAIDESLQGDVPQGQALVLLSDGIHNAAGGAARVLESASHARAMAVPVYTKTLGGKAGVCNLAVELLSPQELSFVGQKVPVRVLLHASGLAGQQATVSLVDQQEKELGKKTATLAADKPVELQFDVDGDKSGVFRYEVRAAPLPGEVTAADNQATFLLRVVDEPIRVLLLEGKPYWDTKFLLRTLAADRSIELVSVVRLAEGRFLQRTLKRPAAKPASETPAAASPPTLRKEDILAQVASEPNAAKPDDNAKNSATRQQDWKILSEGSQLLTDRDALAKYQVVILGRDADVYLSDDALAQVKRWLREESGSLVCFRGPPEAQISQRLAQLLPVRWEATRETRFHIRLTDRGRDLRWIPGDESAELDPLEKMPTLATRAQPLDGQPRGETWAVGEAAGSGEFPVVSSRPFGVAGRVVVVEGAGMWRWALLAPKYVEHDAIYGALWHSLVRWLVSNPGLLPTQNWKLTSDKVRFRNTEQATATLQIRESALKGEVPAIELRRRGETKPLATVHPEPLGEEPGGYRVPFGSLAEGRYEARIAGSVATDPAARTMFDVQRNLDELLHLDANPDLMRRISTLSGGAVLESATPEEIAGQIAEHLARARPEQVRTTTAWDRWWVLAAVFGLWGLSWGVRRWSGLV